MSSKFDPKSKQVLLISIKPEYAKKIFDGEKTIELRKSGPKKAQAGSYLLIYVTAPVKELQGVCKIENIIKDKPAIIWKNFGHKTGITEAEFSEYYNDKNSAYGIELKDIRHFVNQSLKLDFLKNRIPGFTPPQTYRYLSSDFFLDSALERMIT